LVLLLAGLSAQAADIKTGLKAYWPFDQKNFEDAVGIYDGTENGDSPIDFVAGKTGFGQAIQLLGPSDSGGANQFVEITGGEPDDLAFADGSMSVSLWFTVDAWDKSWQAVCAKGEGGNWRIHRRGSENVMGFTGGSAGDTPSGPTDVTGGGWHHLVAIKDASSDTAYLWIDGALDAMRENEGALAANGLRMMIGENPAARNRYWHGLIDDVAVWDRPLTEAEIASLWAGGAGKPLSAFFAPPNDSDNDGMPNDWETQYASCCGLNPNDATDAAKDCNGNGRSNLDEFKAGTDPCDTIKPTIVAIASTGTFDTVLITFSEALDPATAQVTGNYTITPALAVTAATYKNKVVTLTTAAQTPGGTAYTVEVKGVKDMQNWEVPAGTKATFYSYLLTKNNVLKFSYWGNIGGTPVSGLYDDPRYPASPDMTGAVYSFNSRDIFPDDSHENYGATMEGFITPTESGDYRFFIYSDDASQLFLGADDKPIDPLTTSWIAEEPGCCNNFTEPDGTHTRTSEPISLVANKKYSILLVYKEGGGGDYGQVAWRKEGDPTPAGSLRPIPGLYLSSAVDLPFPAEGFWNTVNPAANAKGVAPNVTITVAHTDGKTPWTEANVSMKVDGAPVTPTFTKVGALATVAYKPAALFAAMSVHSVELTYPDPSGQPATRAWSFEVANYPTLTASHKAVSYDASKRGFIWRVFQNETYTHTSLKQTEDALAGKLMNGATPVTDNYANPAAVGVALGDGTLVNNLYEFQIETVINLSQTEGEANGNFAPDGQMPGIPGIYGSTDGIDAEAICYAELPAGAVTMGVNSDDGFRTQAGYIKVPADAPILGQFDGGRGAADTLFVFVVAEAGVYPLRTIWQEGGGGANIEIFSVKENGTKVLLNDTANGGFKTYRVGVAPNKPTEVKLMVTRAGGNVTVTSDPQPLPAGFVLQTAPALSGPWTTQAGVNTPITVPIGTEAAIFLRAAKP
jgi:hypothetical protein